MWRLIWAQLRYSRWIFGGGLGFGLGFLVLASRRMADGDRLLRLMDGGSLLLGIVVGVFLWLRDIRERRGVSWLPLPIPIDAWLWVRLWTPVVLTASLFLVVLGVWGFRALTVGDLELTAVLRQIVPTLGGVLAILLLSPMSEELNIYLRRRRWAIYLSGFVVVAAIAFLAGYADGHENPMMVATTTYGAAGLLAAATGWLYRRRDNYLVVSHPVHGMPVDLAQEQGSFSLR